MATRKSTTVTVTIGKSGYATGQKRTEAEWDTLFPTILKALRNGSTMTEQRAKYGRSEMIRMAARRAGYASIADAIADRKSLSSIKVKGVQSKVLVRRIVEARQSGDSWNTLRLRTGLDKDKLTTLLKEHGHDALANGRVVTSERGKARQAKQEAEAAAAAAKTRTRKPRARKAKAAA